jgi:propionyl-CoA carboxylase alpha chain
MPGNVTATHVEEGTVVELGQLLVILEAMKMEHRITAPVAGTIKQMRVSVGDQVDNGELLVVLEAAES